MGSLTPSQIGYLPERVFYPAHCHLEEYLETMGKMNGLHGPVLKKTVQRRLEQVGLGDMAGWRINACSKGMLQRLGIAQALIADPPFLILDEPVNGLDPAWQKTIRDLLRELRQEGKTLLLSTHLLTEMTQICTHIAILKRGRLILAGPVSEILPLQPTVMISVNQLPVGVLAALHDIHPRIENASNIILLKDEAISYKHQVLQMVLEAGLDVTRLEQRRITMEEIYLEAMAR